MSTVDQRPGETGPWQAPEPRSLTRASSGADFQRLADAITALAGARGADEIIEIVRRSARGLSGAQGVAVILRDDDLCHYLVEDAESPLWSGKRLPITSCISGWAMMHNQTVVIADVFADPRVPHEAYRPTFVKSLIMTPVGEETPFAAIGAYWDRVRIPDPDETAVLGALARSAATAFKNVQLYDSLRREVERAEALHRRAEDELAERKKAEEHLRLVVNELNHRVKNSLATVQSVASQTFRSAGTLREANEAFSQRLQAMGAIHEMLTEANWGATDLRDIARRIVTGRMGWEQSRVNIEGPRVDLSPKAAATLAMGLNELLANAIQHGALSNANGWVGIHWALAETAAGPAVELFWTEKGGPWVVDPAREGFGLRLIRRGVASDLEAAVRLNFASDGLTCTITAPIRALAPQPDDPGLS